jgi:hypothetical protein
MIRRGARALLVLSICAITAAADPPPLNQTDLYTKLAHDCRDVALSSWSHPAKRVFQQSGTTLSKVELCNDSKYPIFAVHLKYDPRTQTSSYFHPLYTRLARANGYWPYSIIDLDDRVIINVGVDPHHEIDVSYEDYRAPQ